MRKEAKKSKMSLAAKKAWETRKKKAGAESGASEKEEPEITVEQLNRAYRKSS